jgi:hypothetical protein
LMFILCRYKSVAGKLTAIRITLAQPDICFVRFQVLTAASMKFRVFWDVATCSHVEVDRRFRGAYCLHHHRPDNAVCTSELATVRTWNLTIGPLVAAVQRYSVTPSKWTTTSILSSFFAGADRRTDTTLFFLRSVRLLCAKDEESRLPTNPSVTLTGAVKHSCLSFHSSWNKFSSVDIRQGVIRMSAGSREQARLIILTTVHILIQAPRGELRQDEKHYSRSQRPRGLRHAPWSLGRWDRGFECRLRNGRFVFVFLFCAVLCRQRSWVGLIPRPGSPTSCRNYS